MVDRATRDADEFGAAGLAVVRPACGAAVDDERVVASGVVASGVVASGVVASGLVAASLVTS